MPRRQRRRWIGGYPDYWEFSPEEQTAGTPVVMTLDEFETIRLLDREGLTQEQCAERMGVSRPTVTAIYDSARKKVAEALVDGKRLQLRGGSYQLHGQSAPNISKKGTDQMRIAVTYENGEIFQHFGHTEQFKLYDVEDGKIISEQIVDTNGTLRTQQHKRSRRALYSLIPTPSATTMVIITVKIMTAVITVITTAKVTNAAITAAAAVTTANKQAIPAQS